MTNRITNAALDQLVFQQTEKIFSNKDPKMPYIGLEHIAQTEARLLGYAESSSSISINSVFRKNDILFGKLRPNLRKSVKAPFDGYCSTDILVLRSIDEVVPGFAAHVFQWERVFAAAVATAAGTKMPRTSWCDLKRFNVFKPESYAEQTRIAYVLDTIDETIAKTEAVIAKLKQVRTGMLHDLLSYGLDEHGQLRDPIAHPEQFKDSSVGRIPREWIVKQLSEFCDTYAGGTPSRGMDAFFGGDIPWVKSSEVNLERIFVTKESLTQAGFNASSAKWIPAGTPLIAMYGATAGQVSWLDIRATCNQAVLAIVPSEKCANARFLFWSLKRVAPQIVKLATGSGQPNLSKAIIDRTSVALPGSVQEQELIAKRIDCLVALQNTERDNLSKLNLLKSGLQDDLLTGRVRVPESIMEGAATA